MTYFAALWLVATVGLIIPTHRPFGRTRQKIGAVALVVLVLGALNQSLLPLPNAFLDALRLDHFSWFAFGINPISAWLAAHLVDGAQWRERLESVLINPVALSMLHSVGLWFLR